MTERLAEGMEQWCETRLLVLPEMIRRPGIRAKERPRRMMPIRADASVGGAPKDHMHRRFASLDWGNQHIESRGKDAWPMIKIVPYRLSNVTNLLPGPGPTWLLHFFPQEQ